MTWAVMTMATTTVTMRSGSQEWTPVQMVVRMMVRLQLQLQLQLWLRSLWHLWRLWLLWWLWLQVGMRLERPERD